MVLATITREYRGAHAILEVLGPDVGYQVQTENRPFDGISADYMDGESIVWIALSHAPFDHDVHGATAIRMIPPTALTGPVLEIEAADGTKTLLRLANPEEHALPPAEGR